MGSPVVAMEKAHGMRVGVGGGSDGRGQAGLVIAGGTMSDTDARKDGVMLELSREGTATQVSWENSATADANRPLGSPCTTSSTSRTEYAGPGAEDVNARIAAVVAEAKAKANAEGLMGVAASTASAARRKQPAPVAPLTKEYASARAVVVQAKVSPKSVSTTEIKAQAPAMSLARGVKGNDLPPTATQLKASSEGVAGRQQEAPHQGRAPGLTTSIDQKQGRESPEKTRGRGAAASPPARAQDGSAQAPAQAGALQAGSQARLGAVALGTTVALPVALSTMAVAVGKPKPVLVEAGQAKAGAPLANVKPRSTQLSPHLSAATAATMRVVRKVKATPRGETMAAASPVAASRQSLPAPSPPEALRAGEGAGKGVGVMVTPGRLLRPQGKSGARPPAAATSLSAHPDTEAFAPAPYSGGVAAATSALAVMPINLAPSTCASAADTAKEAPAKTAAAALLAATAVSSSLVVRWPTRRRGPGQRRPWPYGFGGPYFTLKTKDPAGQPRRFDPGRNTSYAGVIPPMEVLLEGLVRPMPLPTLPPKINSTGPGQASRQGGSSVGPGDGGGGVGGGAPLATGTVSIAVSPTASAAAIPADGKCSRDTGGPGKASKGDVKVQVQSSSSSRGGSGSGSGVG
ncbi:unnamed protein product, partial [Discosporangium mesarthrocarpum]